MNKNNYKKIIIFIFLISLTFSPYNLQANEEIDRLNSQINSYESKLQQINKEIEEQKAKLNSATTKSKTLSNTINQLESTKKKLESDITYTQNKIYQTELILNKLDLEIKEKQILINKNSEGLAQTIRRINDLESSSTIEKFLSYKSISDFWNDYEQSIKLQKKLQSELKTVKDLHSQLKQKELENLTQKNELANQKIILSSEKESVQSTQKEKNDLLKATKNEETTYQKILNEKIAQKKLFEQEILEIESKLQYLIDPNSYPKARKGILSWPVDNVIITQQFGGTSFAKNNPGIYGRAFHPGLDFGVPIGTKVKSVSSGKIKAFGNTDAFAGCSAWGKWVLVEHNNGLSTLYAHLSSILVTEGQTVEAGQTIALSGNTGISTGPHLHLTLYATQGVKVGKYSDFKSGTGCAATGATGPFADLNAYLDPEAYLPNL